MNERTSDQNNRSRTKTFLTKIGYFNICLMCIFCLAVTAYLTVPVAVRHYKVGILKNGGYETRILHQSSPWAELPIIQKLPSSFLRIPDPDALVFRGGESISLYEDLHSFKMVKSLYLTGTVSDRHLNSFSPMENIDTLILNESNVTNSGLSNLKKFPNLRILSLRNLKGVNENCIPDLKNLPKLEELDVTGCSFSKSGLTKLNRTFPTLKIRQK